MKKLFSIIAFIAMIAINFQTIFAQNVTVAGALFGNGSYLTLTAAFNAINGGAQTGANILVTIVANTDEGTGTAGLNAGAWSTLTINPSGARTITGATTAGNPLLNLNGADNVTIDGLNSSGNSLIIQNTTVSATTVTSTIRFIADATSNTITRCSVLGSSSMAVGTNGGNIYFATGTTTGNDNNTISFCDIGPAGANLPTKGIYGNGSTTNTTLYNSGININNCNIYDYFGASVQSAGIYVAGGNTDWTINANKLYQTAARTQVTTGSIHAGIQLASVNINNCTITNNIVGYSSNAGTGTYTLVGVSTSSKFYPIYLSTHGTTTATSIQGNTVTAINFSGPVGGTSTSAPFAGILVSSGLASIGNITGNTIGSTSTSGSITFSSSSASSSDVYGVYYFPSAIANISNNNVGGITLNTSSTGNAVFYGLRAFTTSTVTNTFSNNTIGYSTAPITNNSTVTTSRIIGIYSSSGASQITGNTVRYLNAVTVNTGAGSSSSVMGIWADGTSSTAAHNVSQNTIHTLSNTGAGAISVTGMYTGPTTVVSTSTIYKNFIHSLSASNTSATLQGIYVGAGNATYANNMIRLGVDAAGSSITTALVIYGIVEVGGSNNYYFNSIYIGGTGVGTTANNTICLNSIVTISTRNYQNNILQNSRSNTSTGGPHYTIRLSGTGVNPTGLTSNYNVYYYNGTGGLFGFYNAATNTLSDWQIATGQDANSISGADPQFINPAGTNSTLDLHIHASNQTPIEANGTNIASITDDYDGQTRAALTPVDIGADAGNFVSLPNMTYVSSTTTQNTAATGPGGTNVQVIGIQIVTADIVNPLKVSQMLLNTVGDQGTTNDADLTNAKLYFTGTSSTFTTTTQFGSTISGPTGAMLFSGNQTLSIGTNYFWLAYDISGSATAGNYVDALVTSITGTGTMGTVVPSPNSPTGGRQILAPLSGTYTVGGIFDNFFSLTGSGGAFERINSLGLAGNVILQVTENLNESGLNALNQWIESGAGNYTISIVPSNASVKVISGSVANSMIRFNGNDRVTIDGNNGLDASGTKYLRFRNNNGNNPTFSFFNDSRRNTITNCIIEGNNANISTAPGTILFGTTTGTDGNDSNTISDCDIRDNSDASGTSCIAIFSSGSTTTVAQANSNNTVTGCNIYDFYLNGSTANAALYFSTGTTAWTITNNSIYQTVTRTTTVASGYNIIFLGNSLGDAFTITGNSIGGSAPNCGGSAFTITTSTAGITNFIYAIRFSTASVTNVSTISNNTIANIDLTLDAPVAAGTLYFDAMLIAAGNVNISNNTIGSQSANGNIKVTLTSGINGIGFFGIDMRGAIGSVTNNNVGGFTMAGGNTGTCIMVGINEGSTATTAINVTGNTIGGTISNSMYDSRGGLALAQMTGIRSSEAGVGLLPNISNNTVQNFTDIGSGTGFIAGISHSGTSSAQITNNTITNLNSASSLTGSFSGVHTMCGISLTSTGLGASISNNTISNINNTNSGANNTYVHGIQVTQSAATVTESRNRIYNLTNQSTGTDVVITGINQYWGAAGCTITNNQITITNGEATDNRGTKLMNKDHINLTPLKYEAPVQQNQFQQNQIQQPVNKSKVNKVGSGSGLSGNDKNNNDKDGKNQLIDNKLTGAETVNEEIISENQFKADYEPQKDFTNGLTIYGIYNDATGIQSHYYNSIYIGGTPGSGSSNSYAFRKTSATHNFINNLLVNARTNSGLATGKHYAVYSTSTTASSLNSNYNVYLGSDANTIGLWGTTDQTIAQWRTSLGKDKQTWSTTTSSLNPSNLFTSISTGNLNIITSNTEAWLVSGKGIAVTGQNTDYNGDSRFVSIASGTTDIGSDEFGALSTTTPTATVNFAPGTGVTSTYTLWGRTVLQVVWGSGGSFYPTSLDVFYNSGVNPPNTLGGNYSNSHTVVNSNGNPLSGTTYDITYYFGDNETYTIGTPGVSTILAKYNTAWEVYHLVQPESNSVLTYNTGTQTYTVAVTGLYDFSTFALTDDGSALPVTMENFDIAVVKRDAVLNWTTTSELNNKGFGIERRVKNPTGYSDWKEISFVNGNGTSNERHIYSFKDAKILSGVYQYRLKQVDYNNNTEYYQPTNNSDVIIGKPGSFDVSQNYPNPSNPKSKIDFQMPFDGKVSIKVYDILGQQVASLIDEFKQADFYTVEFDGSNIASGTYFYRIIAEGDNQKFTKTLKMILVK